MRAGIDDKISADAAQKPKRTAAVQAVCKASRLVDHLAEAPAPLSLHALAEATGWPKGTIHGLLSSLAQSGYVEQTADHKYRLGVRLFIYGNRVSSAWEILNVSRPFMRQLAQITQMAVYLAAPQADQALVIDVMDASSAMHRIVRTGALLPLHATAAGKALLAGAPLPELIHAGELTAYTPHTITAPEALARECALVQKEGFARGREEYCLGLQEIAAPIRDENKRALYALCVGDLNRRTTGEEWLRLQSLITATAHTLSLRMRTTE